MANESHVPFSAIVDALNQVPDKIKPDIETLATLIRAYATDTLLVSAEATNDTVPPSELSKEQMALREYAIANRLGLLTTDEIRDVIARRRGDAPYTNAKAEADVAEFGKAIDEYAARRWNQDRRTRVLSMYRAVIARANAAEAKVNALFVDSLIGDSNNKAAP